MVWKRNGYFLRNMLYLTSTKSGSRLNIVNKQNQSRIHRCLTQGCSCHPDCSELSHTSNHWEEIFKRKFLDKEIQTFFLFFTTNQKEKSQKQQHDFSLFTIWCIIKLMKHKDHKKENIKSAWQQNRKEQILIAHLFHRLSH